MGRIRKIILVKGRCFNYLCESREKCIKYTGEVDKDNDIIYPNMVYVLDSCDLFESDDPKDESLDDTYGDIPKVGVIHDTEE